MDLRGRCRVVAFVATLAGSVGTAGAADTLDKTTPVPGVPAAADRMAPPSIVEPIVPNKSELAEAAFKKLDPTGKGYVTRDDVRGLDGFDKAFAAADPGDTGKLTLAGFKKAWAVYSGYKH